MGFLEDAWDFIQGTATGFPDRSLTPGSNQLTASEMDREWNWQAPPASFPLGTGYGPSATRALGGGYGPSASGPLGAAPQIPAPQIQDDGGGGWGWLGDAASWVKDTGAFDYLEGIADRGGQWLDNARWILDPSRQAMEELYEGDLSGAIGDFAGGTANQFGQVGRELGEVGADLGRNAYDNWGLRNALGAVGGFGQGIPGMALDAAQWAGGGLADLGQQGVGYLGDLGGQGLGYLGKQVTQLQDEAADWAQQTVLPWLQQQVYDPAQGFITETLPDFAMQEVLPYFQDDFIEDVTNLAGGARDWAVDDAWGQAIQPFYEDVLKPAGLDIADWAVDDVYQDIITPLYENYLKPAGLATADWTTDTALPWLEEEAWPYIRDNLRHDISDVLEAVPAFVRGVAPEGSRVDDWLEGAVGGIGGAYDFFTESVPAGVGRGYDWLFDPSQPSFGGGEGPASQAEVLEALIASAGGAGGLGGAGALGGAAPSGVSAPGTGANVAGGMVPEFLGGTPGAGAGFGSAGVPAGQPSLAEMYAAMYDRQRDAVEDQYQAGLVGATELGDLGRAYADTVREQGRAAAAEAATAANAYFAEGVDEATRAYNETITALNSREQNLMDRYTEQEAMEAAGIMTDSAEQRRIANDLSDLQRNRNTLRHQMVTGQLDTEEARRMTRLASDEAALQTEVAQMESSRVGQEAALAAQLAQRFSGARASTQKSIEDAEKALRDMGIEPAAYTAAPGAETQALLTSQELSMQTMQNRLRDASAAQAIDRRARGGGIFSQAAQALQDKLFDMRSWADLANFDAQADADLAQAAALGEINLEELARLQASKESIFGKRTDLFDQGELERITTRKEYNAALEVERAAKRRSMEEAQRARVAEEARAAERKFLADEAEADRLHKLEIAKLEAQALLDEAESAAEIAAAEAALAEASRLAEEFITVNVNGVDIPVNRDWYIEEHLIGPGAGADASSDVNLMQMQDDDGNTFFVDVGGVTEEGVPYLTHSAGTDLQLTGAPLTPVWAGEGVDAATLASGSAADLGAAPSSLSEALSLGVTPDDIFGAIAGNLEAATQFSDEASLEALMPGQGKAVSDFLASLG